MNATSLIRFLLFPKPGKIWAINSPFDQELFSLHVAQRWVDRGKARIEDNVLFFHEAYVMGFVRKFQEEELKRRQDEHYERMVDLTRSAGVRTDPSMGVWNSKPSGAVPYGGVGPRGKTRQMRRVWPPDPARAKSVAATALEIISIEPSKN